MEPADSERSTGVNSSINDLVKRTSHLSSQRSDESIECDEIIANRQSRIDTLDQLSQMAANSIKAGLELSEIQPPKEDPFEHADDDDDSGSFETEDLGNAQKTHRVPETMNTIADEEDFQHWQKQGGEGAHIAGPKWIGNIRCFFPDEEGRPRLTIGPNWGFTIFLACLVGMSFYISMSAEINMAKRGASWPYLLLGGLIIFIGIGSFFATLLGDPGIPKEVYRNMARPNERRPAKPEQDSKGFPLCRECEVYVTYNREHCELCDVCIDNPDHHCVFYSKCIGGGNVWYFRLSLVMFVINMTYFFLIYGFIKLAGNKDHSNAHQLLL